MLEQNFPHVSCSGLYGITDATLMPNEQILLERVEHAIRGGMSVLQYRNKLPVDSEVMLREARLLLSLCEDYHVPFIVNDHIALAAKIGAQGVHIGQQDISLAKARDFLGADVIIGVTCGQSIEYAKEAEKGGADYIAFGPCFPSKTKPLKPLAPLSILSEAREHCSLPVVAIGGITVDNCKKVIDCGADMVAVVHALFAAEDVYLQAQNFSRFFTYSMQEEKNHPWMISGEEKSLVEGC